MSDGNKERIAAAPAVAVLALDSRFHEHIPSVMPFMANMVDTLKADDSLRIGMDESDVIAWA